MRGLEEQVEAELEQSGDCPIPNPKSGIQIRPWVRIPGNPEIWDLADLYILTRHLGQHLDLFLDDLDPVTQ